MKYSVKEIFLTIQGEGYNSGRKATFCRFSGCNLWDGKESSKKTSKCNFCDTDFVGVDGINGGKYTLSALINKIEKVSKEFIVFTGGEPLLQLNEKLNKDLKKKNYEIAIETNGTIKPPEGVDWICVSPKIKNEIVLNYGNELKVVYPQEGLNLNEFEKLDFEHFYLQPLHDEKYEQNLKKTLKIIMKYPKWKLSLQTHKFIGVK